MPATAESPICPSPVTTAQVFKDFFLAFRQKQGGASAGLAAFFQAFDHAYQLARTVRATNTPHLDVLGVFGMEFRELRHSDALAWFLRARSPHEQGSLFANALLQRIGLNRAPDENYHVLRERPEYTDVALYAPGHFSVFIENKVRHFESAQQVTGMVEAMSRWSDRHGIPRERRVAVFLTDSGIQPESGPKEDSFGFLLSNLHALSRVEVFECFLAALEKQPVCSPLLRGVLEAYLSSVRRLRARSF
jgi:hypothetical protein